MSKRRARVGRGGSVDAGGASTAVLCSKLGIAQAMARALGLEHARSSAGTPQELTEWQGRPPELVILIDFDATGLAPAIRLLKRHWPHARTLVVGLPNDEGSILDSVAAGADGIVTEQESLAHIEQAMLAVRAGSFRPPPTLIRPLLDRLVWLEGHTPAASTSPRLACLSTRECEVLSHVARGATNKQVAVALQIEEQTIKNQLGRVFRKLNVHTRADAVRVWTQSGPRPHAPSQAA